MPAIVDGRHTLLHLWLRVFLHIRALEPNATAPDFAGNAPGRRKRAGALQEGHVAARVKGFATFEDLQQFPDVTTKNMHMDDARHASGGHYLSKTFNASLRAIGHNGIYSLSVSHPIGDKNLLAISGNFILNGNITGEFEVGVAESVYLCTVIGKRETGPGPGHINLQGAQGLEKPGQIAMLLSPFFDYTAADLTSILSWHVAWHRRLGVNVYVVYATEHLLEVVEMPQIKALVRAGILHLIRWNDMVIADPRKTSVPFFRYSHQNHIYNHALLALHAPDSLVLVADLDEYLALPEPMTIKQAVASCVPGKERSHVHLGALLLPRVSVFHASFAAEARAELSLWTTAANTQGHLADLLPDLRGHPLQNYSVCSENCLFGIGAFAAGQARKSIYDPCHVTVVEVHYGKVKQGTWAGKGKEGCAQWLHVVNMRREYRWMPANLSPLERKWLWPTV